MRKQNKDYRLQETSGQPTGELSGSSSYDEENKTGLANAHVADKTGTNGSNKEAAWYGDDTGHHLGTVEV